MNKFFCTILSGFMLFSGQAAELQEVYKGVTQNHLAV